MHIFKGLFGFKSFNDVHAVNSTLYLAKQQAGQQNNGK